MQPDIIISKQLDGYALVSGCTPKGIEWLMNNSPSDQPKVENRFAGTTAYTMRLEGVVVEIVEQT